MRFSIAAIMFSFLLPGATLAQSNATPPQTNTKKPAAQAATKPPEDKTVKILALNEPLPIRGYIDEPECREISTEELAQIIANERALERRTM